MKKIYKFLKRKKKLKILNLMKIKGEDLFLKQNHMFYANKMNY